MTNPETSDDTIAPDEQVDPVEIDTLSQQKEKYVQASRIITPLINGNFTRGAGINLQLSLRGYCLIEPLLKALGLWEEAENIEKNPQLTSLITGICRTVFEYIRQNKYSSHEAMFILALHEMLSERLNEMPEQLQITLNAKENIEKFADRLYQEGVEPAQFNATFAIHLKNLALALQILEKKAGKILLK